MSPTISHEELASAEVMLVNAASPLSVADTRRLVEYWKTAVDGPGSETTADELEDRRYLHASKTFQGMVKIDGLFDPVTGDLILTALDAAMPHPQLETTPGLPGSGEPTPSPTWPAASSTRDKRWGPRNPTSWSSPTSTPYMDTAVVPTKPSTATS